jgi:(2Fe-2S) ferredoxin
MNTIHQHSPSHTVLICQNSLCRKLKSREVLEAFLAEPVPNVEVKGVGCLGQCGNGPMVLILPETVWYWRVKPHEVSILIEKHLKGNSPVLAMLYPKFIEKMGAKLNQ